MPMTLPLPVRIAAGVLATGLDRLRQLPQDLPALSVTVVGQAVRASMRVQQEITQLATRGDEMLAGLTSRPSERPPWAHFDDEDGAPTGPPADAGVPTRPPGDAGVPSRQRPRSGARPGRKTARIADAAAGTPVTGPADLPGYDELRITQVRARLRGLDAAAVTRLLDYEQGRQARAPYLTLLTNRLTTLQGGTAQESEA